MKILVVDDDLGSCREMADSLRQLGRFEILGETNSLQETINAVEKTKPDIVLIDNKNIKKGYELNLIKENVGFKTLVLCPTGIEASKVPFKYFFDGFLSKEAPIEEILLAIRTVKRGTFYVSPNLSEKIIKQDFTNPAISKLNEQETRIFYYLSKGKTNTEIARELFLSTSTVKTYVSKILNKLNLPNRAAVAVFAAKTIENGYLRKLT